MCGIAGIIRRTEPAPLPQEVLHVLSKRGPDAYGQQTVGNCTLGHTRLSVIDLSSGAQPMMDAGKNLITFNGEIYNYKELRNKLEKVGHFFSTESDTEVILKAYREYGPGCVSQLDGMFAFAIWDVEKKTLFIARDRFGKKPLYYAERPDGSFVFASEIKALVAAGVTPHIDPAGIDAYLALMYVPPWRTLYTNIHNIPPAHCGTYTNGTLSLNQYWQLVPSVQSISYADAKDGIRHLLKESVRKRMIADVEIGAFLSGGVDSTLISAYAQELTSHKLKTFAFGYGDAINELPFAEEAANNIGTEHYSLQAPPDLFPELSKVLGYFDEPHADSADIAQHLVSELASSKVKVALSGDGGDELFMGYGWYWSYFNRPKHIALKNALFSSPFAEHLRSITVFPERQRRALLKASLDQHIPLDTMVQSFSGNGLEKINAYDLTTYLPGQLLSKVDQMSMMHSLEVRCPLLDYKLAEFAYSLPLEFKVSHSGGKIILKDLLREIMPNAFVDRRKQGFGAPVRTWLSTGQMERDVRELLSSKAYVHTFLNPTEVARVVDRAYQNKNPKEMYRLWILVCLEMWLREHTDWL